MPKIQQELMAVTCMATYAHLKKRCQYTSVVTSTGFSPTCIQKKHWESMLQRKRGGRLNGAFSTGLLLAILLILSLLDRCEAFPIIYHEWELAVQLTAVGLTNLFMALPIFAAWKAVCVVEVVTGFFAMVTSSIYHCIQAVEYYRGIKIVRFLGGNSADWHRADNVFSCASIAALLLQPLQITKPAFLVGIQVMALSLAAIGQCVDPWKIWRLNCTPVVGSSLCLIVGLSLRLWKRELPKITNRWYLVAASFSFPVAILFFVFGLNTNEDYLRLKHGMWHVMISVTAFCTVRAFNPKEVVVKRRLFMFGFADSKDQELLPLELSADGPHFSPLGTMGSGDNGA